MNNKLKLSSHMAIGFMLFALFFGAGNLIFPAQLGQHAGTSLGPAAIGFLITGVGLIGNGLFRKQKLARTCEPSPSGIWCVFYSVALFDDRTIFCGSKNGNCCIRSRNSAFCRGRFSPDGATDFYDYLFCDCFVVLFVSSKARR